MGTLAAARRRRRVQLESLSAGNTLLIGAAGLVGRHLRDAFADRPLTATFHRNRVAGTELLDITDASAVHALFQRVRPDVVLLAAAEVNVERCEREPAEARRINVTGASYVADAAREASAAFVVFSSEYVFDGRQGPYVEDDPVTPLNEYGRQKVEVEAIARCLPRGLICRTSGVFGWEPAGKNFICQLVRHLRAGERFAVPSDQVITPTYAPTLAATVRELVDAGHAGTFHVAGPRITTRMEFAGLAARTFGLDESLLVPRATGELGGRAVRPKNAGLRTDRIHSAIGHGLVEPAAALAAMRASEQAPQQGL